MKIWKAAFVAGAVLLLVGPSAMAQQRAAAKACAGDIKTLCAGVQPGAGRIKACIKAHMQDLSEPCRGALAKAAVLGKACRSDVKHLCADVKPGGGRIEACMKTHMAEVSEP